MAHRGASSIEPEHTLAAYRLAIDEGADALEADVRLTADGYLVCLHDRTLRRTAGGNGAVSARTLTQLARNDFSRYRQRQPGSPRRPWSMVEPVSVPDDDRRRLLTLDALLRLVLDAPRRVELALETKHPTRFGGYVEELLVETLDRFGLARPPRDGSSQVRLMSFSEIALRRMRVLAPGIPTVLLMDRVPLRFRDGTLPFGARVAGPSVEIVRVHPGYVQRVHDAGGQVHVWTVDEPADVAMCVDLGVDAIITNRPRQVLAQLGR